MPNSPKRPRKVKGRRAWAVVNDADIQFLIGHPAVFATQDAAQHATDYIEDSRGKGRVVPVLITPDHEEATMRKLHPRKTWALFDENGNIHCVHVLRGRK